MAATSHVMTVDLGLPSDVFPGHLVMWLHQPRGGYGYVLPIPARVIRHARIPGTWVEIEVEKTDGTLVRRRVRVENLRAK